MHDVKDGKKEEMLLDNFSSNQPFFFFFHFETISGNRTNTGFSIFVC